MCRRFFFACILVAALAALFFPVGSFAQVDNGPRSLITRNINEMQLNTLRSNTRSEAIAGNDRGIVRDDLSMEHMLLQLKRSPEQEQELKQYVEELTDSNSPNFHHWLTAKEFGDKYGVAPQDRDAIKSWLESHGLKVNVDYENGILIDFSGTAGQVKEAFHTEIHELEVAGVKHFANMTDPQIPAALEPAIAGVVSLHDFHPRSMSHLRPNYTGTNPYGNPSIWITPSDLATMYNLNPLFKAGISGQGQTIAVIEDSNVYTVNDWKSFRSKFGLSGYKGTLTQIHPAPAKGANNCANPGVTGNDTEATLDAEFASAAAPSAAIVLASCKTTSTFGGLIALQNLLNQTTAPPALVSISYGECEAFNGAASNAAFGAAYQQAASEGVSVFVAAGDSGGAGCDAEQPVATHGIGVNGFASTPYNVSVGGTQLSATGQYYLNTTNSATDGSAPSYLYEVAWNDTCASPFYMFETGLLTPLGPTSYCNYQHGEFAIWSGAMTTTAGGGGPSGCATGKPAESGVVGGTCQGWAKPSWQKMLGNSNDKVRDIPDVSLFAGDGYYNGVSYLVCFSGPGGAPCTGAPDTWPSGGGTSFSTPIMAGFQALVNQKTGEKQGNPNPVYYKLANTEYGTAGSSACNAFPDSYLLPSASCIFYDEATDPEIWDWTTNTALPSSTAVPCIGTHNCDLGGSQYGTLSTSDTTFHPTYLTAKGWDFATGIGSVNAANLVNNWPKGKPNFTISTQTPAVTIGQGQGSSTSTISLTPINGFSGTVTLAASDLPAGVTAFFSHKPRTSDRILGLIARDTAESGTYLLTITGTSGSLKASTTITLTVKAGKLRMSPMQETGAAVLNNSGIGTAITGR
jgi:subtilase family serine protease